MWGWCFFEIMHYTAFFEKMHNTFQTWPEYMAYSMIYQIGTSDVSGPVRRVILSLSSNF